MTTTLGHAGNGIWHLSSRPDLYMTTDGSSWMHVHHQGKTETVISVSLYHMSAAPWDDATLARLMLTDSAYRERIIAAIEWAPWSDELNPTPDGNGVHGADQATYRAVYPHARPFTLHLTWGPACWSKPTALCDPSVVHAYELQSFLGEWHMPRDAVEELRHHAAPGAPPLFWGERRDGASWGMYGHMVPRATALALFRFMRDETPRAIEIVRAWVEKTITEGRATT